MVIIVVVNNAIIKNGIEIIPQSAQVVFFKVNDKSNTLIFVETIDNAMPMKKAKNVMRPTDIEVRPLILNTDNII
jgi:hypothetical protein